MKLKVLKKDELLNRLAIIVGTRPGIIKFASIIKCLISFKINPIIIHTSQHYSYELDEIFFEELGLPKPQHRIIETKNAFYHGEQTAEMLLGIEKVLLKEKPKVVMVGGDANTNLAGALAARKLGIDLIHLEAGLRSNDWKMPEEHNRVMIDHISEILLAPTTQAVENLKSEGIKGKIFLVGNVISDAVIENKPIAEKKSKILEEVGVKANQYLLITLHREENVDNSMVLRSIHNSIINLAENFSLPIIFPIHPRTANRLKDFNLSFDNKKIKIIKPVGYFDFLHLLSNCKVVLTDSGGIQEEACILGIPCLTIRENTERPETVLVGANKIVGYDSQKILKETKTSIENTKRWDNPYGDDVAKKIVKVIQDEFDI